MRPPSSRQLTALAACAVAAVVPGCSCNVSVGGGSDTIDKSDEVANAQKFLDRQLTSLPPTKSVSCPSGVDAKAGTTFACTATLTNGQKVTIPLRVATANGSHGTISSDPGVIDQALAVDLIYQAAQSPAKSVDCPTNIEASVGKTFNCTATLEDGTTSTVTLRLQSADPNGNQNMRVVAAHRS